MPRPRASLPIPAYGWDDRAAVQKPAPPLARVLGRNLDGEITNVAFVEIIEPGDLLLDEGNADDVMPRPRRLADVHRLLHGGAGRDRLDKGGPGGFLAELHVRFRVEPLVGDVDRIWPNACEGDVSKILDRALQIERFIRSNFWGQGSFNPDAALIR